MVFNSLFETCVSDVLLLVCLFLFFVSLGNMSFWCVSDCVVVLVYVVACCRQHNRCKIVKQPRLLLVVAGMRGVDTVSLARAKKHERHASEWGWRGKSWPTNMWNIVQQLPNKNYRRETTKYWQSQPWPGGMDEYCKMLHWSSWLNASCGGALQ